MADGARARAFHGVVVHSTGREELTILDNALLAVDASGRIVALEPDFPTARLAGRLAELGLAQCPVTELSRGQFLVPGFVDTHNHATQWLHRGLG
ncbi:Putative guanine deaminase [Tolypocladium paradoxum]|uniref:Guanine deaminase n=1 Tax=Tolypocladium paradoxum TaxID=94208 RepID=A0A2S4LA58_9HYPO|nr:Putative guanine deaminase [Tolypocladium paradoxum]